MEERVRHRDRLAQVRGGGGNRGFTQAKYG